MSVLVLLVACGSAAKAPAPRIAVRVAASDLSLASGTVFTGEMTTAGLSVHAVRDSDGSDLGSIPRALTSRDGLESYLVRDTPSRALVGWDNRGGRQTLAVAVPAGFNLAADYAGGGGPGPFSPDGRWLILFGDPPATSVLTRFLVVDTTGATAARTIELAGSFEFDAIDNQGSTVYLIQRPTGGAAYRVRAYDLRAGALKPGVIASKGAVEEAMSGYRAASISSVDGAWLFSLYRRLSGSAFVHALSLRDQFAVCIDLPVPGGQASDTRHWSLATDGGRLFAINAAAGEAVTVDIASLKVTRHATFAVPRVGAGQDAASGNGEVTADGSSVLAPGPNGVLDLSSQTLALERVLLRADNAVAVRLVGASLLAVAVPGRSAIDIVDLATGNVVRSLALQGRPTGIMAVTPWVASQEMPP
ncbi:MAG: hypothetical protein ACYDGR_05525 [Candidatus Dormibacteria bacterium]